MAVTLPVDTHKGQALRTAVSGDVYVYVYMYVYVCRVRMSTDVIL